jgi:tetratricopeptide (TPR) repeat protein
MIDYRPAPVDENQSLLDKGITLYKQKAFDQALAVFQKAVVIKPDFAVAHYNIGNVYSDLGVQRQRI